MQLTGSYKQILGLSIPIMIGSAAQQVITLSDSVFLFPKGENDFAAIGFSGVFYLVIAAIGYGFSKGGQIMIARRTGEGNDEAVGANFHAMLIFELIMATLLFFFMRLACPYIFDLALESDIVYQKSLEYLHYRSFGVFFSYVGLSFIALYTGIARTGFIMIDTIILGVLNIILNYGLIYGAWGLPEMGIAGAGLASTIAEIVAFILFVIYVIFDKKAKRYKIFSKPKLNLELIKTQISISSPIVLQSVLGLGSWFVFFAVVDNLGERELAKANLVRMVYLVLSIPTWGFSSGINTMVSNCLGQNRMDLIMPVTFRTTMLTLGITLAMMLPILYSPEYFLTFIFKFGKDSVDLNIIQESTPILYVLSGVLIAFNFGAIYFNALSGTGATFQGLKIQIGCVIFYLIAIYTSINFLSLGQEWAWGVEMLYWGIMFGVTLWYLKSEKWKKLVF
jgi:MATE family multidrug resistance protein